MMRHFFQSMLRIGSSEYPAEPDDASLLRVGPQTVQRLLPHAIIFGLALAVAAGAASGPDEGEDLPTNRTEPCGEDPSYNLRHRSVLSHLVGSNLIRGKELAARFDSLQFQPGFALLSQCQSSFQVLMAKRTPFHQPDRFSLAYRYIDDSHVAVICNDVPFKQAMNTGLDALRLYTKNQVYDQLEERFSKQRDQIRRNGGMRSR